MPVTKNGQTASKTGVGLPELCIKTWAECPCFGVVCPSFGTGWNIGYQILLVKHCPGTVQRPDIFLLNY